MRRFVDNHEGNVSIVVVLHQPSARVFNLLQNVILMSRGTIIYSGPPNGAIDFLSECNFNYLKENDPQNRSAAEYILDVISGEESSIKMNELELSHHLKTCWIEKFSREERWKKIQVEMEDFRKREHSIFKTLLDEDDSKFQPEDHNTSLWTRIIQELGVFEHCRDLYHQSDVWCVVLLGTPFPLLPKPGLRKQLHLWFWLMIKLTYRKGIEIHILVVHSLALTVAFVRSFNSSWSRRPHANFVLTIVISLLGMIGSVYMDDIGPVQRAAASGMILAAHELASLAHSLIMGWFVCHWFALNYFFFLWLRTGIFCCANPFRFEKYYEFTHILHLTYMVSSGVGSCVCAVTSHDLRASFILCIGFLMHFHVFALFSPSRSQAERDAKILFGKIDVSPLVLFYAKWSYVRYTQEALLLWEPDVDSDKVGRAFTLRYFSWEETNFVKDLTWMFALWTLAMAFRFVLFAINNVNAYNTAFDIPLFIVFILKILSLHFTALVMMTLVHEIYTSWKMNQKLSKLEQSS